jgi:hypothetical protein
MTFTFNKWNTQTGDIVYENDQVMVSGLKSYNEPYLIVTGVRFVVIDRNQYIQTDKESRTTTFDDIIVQFGWDELKKLNETGIKISKERTRIRYDGDEFRVVEVTDHGQKYNRKYMPLGLIEAKIRKRKTENVN